MRDSDWKCGAFFVRAYDNNAPIISPLWLCQVFLTDSWQTTGAMHFNAWRLRIHPLSRPSTCGSSDGAEQRAVIRLFHSQHQTACNNSGFIMRDMFCFFFLFNLMFAVNKACDTSHDGSNQLVRARSKALIWMRSHWRLKWSVPVDTPSFCGAEKTTRRDVNGI